MTFKRFSVPILILSRASTGCSKEIPTELWPAFIRIYPGYRLQYAAKVVERHGKQGHLLPNAQLPEIIKVAIWASRAVP